jgi:hypothetical protein
VPDRRAVPYHGPPFFLSYARAESRSSSPRKAQFSDQMAERLYFDLAQNVDQLIGRRTGEDPGFMDTRIPGGMQWADELLHAAGTCQMLIALISAPYLNSEWCGLEWCAFSRRSAGKLSGVEQFKRQGWIIPVHWAPVSFPLPSRVRADMFFSPESKPDPDLPAQYRADGVFGLLRTGQESAYQTIAWHLAKRISNIYHSQHLKRRRFNVEDLRNCFQEGGRRG